MALASDLMGLGVAPLQAARTANGGVGPILAAVKGSTYATGYQIGCSQYFINVTGGTAGVLSLPAIGGDNGALLADDFIICNNCTGTITLLPPSGVSIVGAGGTGTTLALTNNTIYQIWAQNTTTWIYK